MSNKNIEEDKFPNRSVSLEIENQNISFKTENKKDSFLANFKKHVCIYNGRYSIVGLILLVLSLGFTLIVTKVSTMDKPNKTVNAMTILDLYDLNEEDKTQNLDVVTVLFVILNILGIMSYAYRIFKTGSSNNRNTRDSDDTLLVTFPWVFSIFSILYFFFELILDFKSAYCIDTVNEVIRVIFRCTLLVLFTVQMIYLTYYKDHTFMQSLVTHFGFIGMFSSVCSVWFHYLMSEIVHDDPNANIDAAYACLKQDDKMRIIMEGYIEPLLQPIVIECTLVALQFLLKIWSSSTSENDSNPTVTHDAKVAPRLNLKFANYCLCYSFDLG